MSRITLNIGGVPEHFNLPWHLCIEEGKFDALGVEVNWTDYPGGTGAMTRELRHGSLDVALVLTEGMIADICLGNKSKIVCFYTDTPLIWGVHTTAYSKFEVVKDVIPPIFAISRWGSGSHLMAYVFAKNQGWNPKTDISFKVVSNLDGARESLGNKTSNLFMWERFTTKPFVDSGELKHLTNQATPWPCFVVAARNKVLRDYQDTLNQVIQVVLNRAQELKQDAAAAKLIATRYQLDEHDVNTWLSATEWAHTIDTKADVVEDCLNTLEELEIVKNPLPVEGIIAY